MQGNKTAHRRGLIFRCFCGIIFPCYNIRYPGEYIMNKIFFILLPILPVAAFGADFSDCDVIGHKVYDGTVEECMTPPEICKEDPNSTKCLNNIKTAEQCAQPATQERIKQKSGAKVTTNLNYVYSDGTPVDNTAMIEDSNFVYIFRMGAGLFGVVTYTDNYQDYIIGTPESDGTNLALFKQN